MGRPGKPMREDALSTIAALKPRELYTPSTAVDLGIELGHVESQNRQRVRRVLVQFSAYHFKDIPPDGTVRVSGRWQGAWNGSRWHKGAGLDS